MKKLYKLLALCLILSMCACTNQGNGNQVTENTDTPQINVEDNSKDALAFKEEYESYNGTINENNGKEYLTITIDEKNPIYNSSLSEVTELIKSGTGVIYLGYPTCPWCRNALPALFEQASQTGIDKIYYVNMKEARDTKKLDDDGKIITTKEPQDGYYELLAALGNSASVYEGLNDESVRRIYVPAVIVVKEGEVILYHESTVESQLDPYTPLDEAQFAELKKIYKDGFMKMLYDVCDSKC